MAPAGVVQGWFRVAQGGAGRKVAGYMARAQTQCEATAGHELHRNVLIQKFGADLCA